MFSLAKPPLGCSKLHRGPQWPPPAVAAGVAIAIAAVAGTAATVTGGKQGWEEGTAHEPAGNNATSQGSSLPLPF